MSTKVCPVCERYYRRVDVHLVYQCDTIDLAKHERHCVCGEVFIITTERSDADPPDTGSKGRCSSTVPCPLKCISTFCANGNKP